MAEHNELTTQSISKLIRRIAIPASVGFFFNTMYNVVDTYYSGLLSTQAVAALALSFPVFFIIVAVGSGISTGTSALISNALGEGNKEKAMKYLSQAISFTVMVSIGLSIVGWLSGPFLFKLLGATGEYLEMALTYINVIFGGVLFFALSFVINSSLSAQGDTKTYRNFLIFGFLLNLALDPWFMFGGFGLPAMGIAGVAWATLFIQFLGVVYMLYKTIKTGMLCKTCWHMLRPEKVFYKEIFQQGFPASLNMMTVAIGIFIITYFISPFGKEAVAAYGIATRIDQIVLMPTIGLNVACLTLIGQNNGARKFDRVREAYKRNLYFGSIAIAVGMLIVLVFARPLMDFFSDDSEVINIGSTFLRISAITYWAYMILFISISALQGLKKPNFAIWLGLFRQIVGPAVIFWLLANVMGFDLLGIWWGIFIITWSGAIIAYVYAKRNLNKLG